MFFNTTSVQKKSEKFYTGVSYLLFPWKEITFQLCNHVFYKVANSKFSFQEHNCCFRISRTVKKSWGIICFHLVQRHILMKFWKLLIWYVFFCNPLSRFKLALPFYAFKMLNVASSWRNVCFCRIWTSYNTPNRTIRIFCFFCIYE